MTLVNRLRRSVQSPTRFETIRRTATLFRAESRRTFGEWLAARGRSDLAHGRTVIGLARIVLATLSISPVSGSRLIVDLVRCGYLASVARSAKRGGIPAIPHQRSRIERILCGADISTQLGLSKVALELGLVEMSCRLRSVSRPAKHWNRREHLFEASDLQSCAAILVNKPWLAETRRVIDATTDGMTAISDSEALYRSLVNNRSVVLVGGSSQSLTVAESHAIKTADTVIQLKFFGGSLGRWDSRLPQRVDVAYYISTAREKLVSLLRGGVTPHDLGLSQTKVIVFLDRVPAEPIGIPTCLHRTRLQFTQGTAQIGQRVVVDVLRHRPGSLHLLGFDGYLSPQSRHAYRTEVSQRVNFFSSLNSFSSHDIWENRYLLQDLYKSGHISVSDAMASYLSMSDHDYAIRLDQCLRAEFRH